MEHYTRKQLLDLPARHWNTRSLYSTLILFPSPQKHDSGWGCMTIVGCNDGKAIEIITQSSDDVSVNGAHRVDCLHKAKAMHFWARGK
jgi:hypothetical protein